MTTSKEYCDVICDAIDTYGREAQTDMCIEAVSYTHLTLPTIA